MLSYISLKVYTNFGTLPKTNVLPLQELLRNSRNSCYFTGERMLFRKAQDPDAVTGSF